MQEYVCHKKVHAAQIVGIYFEVSDEKTNLRLERGNVMPVNDAWIGRNTPEGGQIRDLIGGYFVLYDDNYTSWSPAEAFENGYTLVSEPTDMPAEAAPTDG